jgi:hypothetical protein
LDTYAKINREIAELEQKQKNGNENTNEMAQKAKANDSRKAIMTASQESQIRARLTMVNMIDTTVQTILTQRSSRGTTTVAKVTKLNLMVTRRQLSRENLTRKPTTFESKSNSNQKRTQSIIMTLRRIQNLIKTVTMSVISADFYFTPMMMKNTTEQY